MTDLSDLPLPKLRELLASHVWEMRRREMSDNFYYTSGRFAADNSRKATLELHIKERERSESRAPST